MRVPSAVLPVWLAACISSNPPAPAVRWFDPRPAPPPALAPPVAFPRPRVSAAAGVRQEFVLRIGPRELAIDELHRWSAPPDELVAEALVEALAGPTGAEAGEPLGVEVVRFELDLTAGQAVVELRACAPEGLLRVEGRGPCSSRDPAALAEAMAGALADAALALRTALQRGGAR